MKICIFSANYFPNLGGVERYTYYLSKELMSKGHKVTLVTSNVFDLPSYEVAEGLEIFRLPCYNVMKGRYPVYKRNAEFKKTDTKLREKSFDFILINTRFYFHSLYGAKLAKQCNIPCAVVEHGSSHLSVNNKVFDYLGGIWEHMLTAVLKHRCTEYYGVSQVACEWSGHFGIKSKETLYNAVDLGEIENIAAESECSYRKEYNISEDAVVITFTGRLLKEKGIYQLIRAFKRLEDKNVYLIFAGDGPEADAVKPLCDERIIMLGRIDFEHIIALLKESDIFCLPSVSEGMSTSVLEAVATKTFVITTATGGAKELITSEELGIITKGNSEQEIYDALCRAVEDKLYRSYAAEKSYERLKNGFTWAKTADKLEEIMRRKT